MISTLLSTHRKQFAGLAAAWLAAGATSFSIWQDENVVACWPPVQTSEQAEWVAPIVISSGLQIGELRVGGMAGDAGGRLQADAALVAAMAELSADLDTMAAALAETEDQLLALYELSKSGASHLDVNELLPLLAHQANRLVKAEGAFVLVAPDQIVQAPAELAPQHLIRKLFERLQTTGSELLLNAADLPHERPAHADTLFMTSLLTDGGRDSTACLGLWLDRAAATLSPDLKLARAIAEQGGAQLEIALLHRELVAQARLQAELDLARQVQVSLLPRLPPSVAGLDLFAESRPALKVGGDFYDFYLGSGKLDQPARLTFSVGDVSGKGISAALLMAMTRTTLRETANGKDTMPTPEQILGRANAGLYDDFTDVGMMATVFVGQYDAAAGQLLYANAGHSPVIFCPVTGGARVLEADGPIMGVLPVSLSHDQVLPFGPGDVLAVLTDGFNEARNQCGELLGIERLQQIVESVADQSASDIARSLFAEVARFSDNQPQDDDQTLLIVKGI
jgi:sigma-B regulation protein RsbU (phosphoserine phosphatase)